MFESKLEPVTKKSLLTRDLLHLYDEITEFNDHCAFLCDAFACLAAEEDGIDASTAQGLSRQAGWMKRQMEALKSKLNQIYEKAYAEDR